MPTAIEFIRVFNNAYVIYDCKTYQRIGFVLMKEANIVRDIDIDNCYKDILQTSLLNSLLFDLGFDTIYIENNEYSAYYRDFGFKPYNNQLLVYHIRSALLPIEAKRPDNQ